MASDLPCGCVPHETRMSHFGTAVYCETEGQPYCNFECPHEDENTDWCSRCDEITTYDGEICTKCGRVWGED